MLLSNDGVDNCNKDDDDEIGQVLKWEINKPDIPIEKNRIIKYKYKID